MIPNPYSYSLYFDFIESYLPKGFQNINPDDPIMLRLEKIMAENNQFFLVMDLTEIKIIYASKRSIDMVGVEPAKLTPYEMMDAVHPDDVIRFGMGRSKILSLDKDLFMDKKGSALLSTTIKMQRRDKEYSNLLFQCYLFYSPIPHKSVFEIQVHTNIDCYNFRKSFIHYYSGDNISLFKCPDMDLLKIGPNLTPRELDIVKLVEAGLSSKQIAEKLFISVYTINTHRTNILKKTGKATVSDLIYELKEQGVL